MPPNIVSIGAPQLSPLARTVLEAGGCLYTIYIYLYKSHLSFWAGSQQGLGLLEAWFDYETDCTGGCIPAMVCLKDNLKDKPDFTLEASYCWSYKGFYHLLSSPEQILNSAERVYFTSS